MQMTRSFQTLCVGEVTDPRTTAPHILPLYLTSSFAFDSVEQGEDIFRGKSAGHVYGRYGNPTIEAVAAKIAALETHDTHIEAAALLTSSGMSAISTLAIALLQNGDAILTQNNLYGGTTELFLKVLQPLGIQIITTDLADLAQTENLFRQHSNIKLCYFETPANPTLACLDIRALAALATKYNALSVADNTFATPYLQQPLALGCDYLIHSTTKYLNGHGNSIAGIIVGRHLEVMGGRIWQVLKLAGTNVSPFEAWLIHNGLKTLPLRMKQHCQNALQLAEWLENHPAVERVNYPGLPTHPSHRIARSQMRAFGGMLSFELRGGLKAAIRMMNSTRLCTLAPTLGDVDTLLLHPATQSHLNIPPEIRLQAGITDGLIRVSVGIEDIADIIADIQQAIE